MIKIINAITLQQLRTLGCKRVVEGIPNVGVSSSIITPTNENPKECMRSHHAILPEKHKETEPITVTLVRIEEDARPQRRPLTKRRELVPSKSMP